MIDFFKQQVHKNKIYIKYTISGVTGAVAHFSILTFFYKALDLWIVFSTSIGFIVAFFISFFLQKFWTFRDNNRKKMIRQMAIYFTVAVINFAINGYLMHLLVEKIGIWFLLSQVLVTGAIAIESFLVYKFLIFNK